MTNKKTTEKLKPSLSKEKPSLNKDLKEITIPFDLSAAFDSIVKELKAKEFDYIKLIHGQVPVLKFKLEELKEIILIDINKENLTVKQLTEGKEKDKLKVIYIIKPSERNFNIILKK